jgi:hypothetical protein
MHFYSSVDVGSVENSFSFGEKLCADHHRHTHTHTHTLLLLAMQMIKHFYKGNQPSPITLKQLFLFGHLLCRKSFCKLQDRSTSTIALLPLQNLFQAE